MYRKTAVLGLEVGVSAGSAWLGGFRFVLELLAILRVTGGFHKMVSVGGFDGCGAGYVAGVVFDACSDADYEADLGVEFGVVEQIALPF